jgi:hypothetical protein
VAISLGAADEINSWKINGVLAEGTITAADLVGPLSGKSLSDLMTDVMAGETYVNVHTTQNPAGEIRGQIIELRG